MDNDKSKHIPESTSFIKTSNIKDIAISYNGKQNRVELHDI